MRRATAGLLLLISVLLVSFPFQTIRASTPIAFDFTNSTSCIFCSTFSWSHTVGAGSNRVLIVGVSTDSYVPVVSIKFGANSLTHLGTQPGIVGVELWGLLNPPAGTAMITVNFGVGNPIVIGGSVSYFNVGSIGTAVGADAVSTTASVMVSTNPTDLVVDAISVLNGAFLPSVSPTAGQTQRWNIVIDLGANFAGAGSDKPASGSSTIMSWSISPFATDGHMIAVPLSPPTPPIPEYPFGLALLAAFTVVAYGMIKGRTRISPDINRLVTIPRILDSIRECGVILSRAHQRFRSF